MKKLLLFTFLFSYAFIYGQSCDGFKLRSINEIELPGCNKNNGVLTITKITGGSAPYSFTLDTIKNQTGIFTDLPVGTYSIIIKDQKGCKDTLEVDFNYKNLENIIKPYNAFTPNDDNINDLWVIPGISSFPRAVIRIFNRYGQLLYTSQNYSNKLGWNGTQNGKKVPPGTYFYTISAVNTCAEEYLNGTVTVAR